MILLAYDTSASGLSLGLYENNHAIYEQDDLEFARHSAILIPSIERALKRADLSMDALDAIGVGLGPGSFTGLRVGLMTAKVLAHIHKKKLYGISSLEAMARSLNGFSGEIAICLDARKTNAYVAHYRKKGDKLTAVMKPQLMPAEKFYQKAPEGALFISDLKAELPLKISQKFLGIADASLLNPKARSIALAVAHGAKPIIVDQLEPLYLYPRDCNVTTHRRK